MTVSTGFATAALIALSAVSGQALAATAKAPPCITKDEMRAGLAFLTPTLVRGLKTKCVAVLPAGSYMASRGDDLIARFKATPSQNPEALRTLMTKVLPSRDIPESANGAMAEAIAETVVGRMQNDIKPSLCPKLDAAFSQLDPLPAENVIGLLEIIVTEIVNDPKRPKAAPVTFCPATQAKPQ